MRNGPLVLVDYYSNKIRKLSIVKRIGTDYPILIRKDVAKILSKVSDKLPRNIFLQVDSGHRSREIQEKLWKIRKKQENSNSKVKGLVFNPFKGTPPHSTGGAVDVTLTDSKGREINLSEPFNKYYIEPRPKSRKVSKKAQELRMILRKLMLNEGFAPNPREYWHFSYGDIAWAKYYKRKKLYNEIKVPKIMYYPIHKRIIYRLFRIAFRIINNLLKIDTNY